MTLSCLAIVALVWIAASASALAILFRRELARAWREPVLTEPVLIVESDDWGYGPTEQAARLRQLAQMLGRHRDRTGRPAVMTLGIVLAGPDTPRMARGGWKAYQRLSLADAPLESVRAAIGAGVREGVFAPQLHGMEHFHPPALMTQAADEPAVRVWLSSQEFPATEGLPPRLQSRWLDVPADALVCTAAKEAQMFTLSCGTQPEVAVPPTFVWTEEVERAWFAAGVRVVVTPGRRFTGRDAAGRPAAVDAHFYNGEAGASGMLYLVRDDYFEPSLGHPAERALAALAAKSRYGRPTLLETHRSNFLDAAIAARSMVELERLLETALRVAPGLRFMSSAELGRHYRERSSLVERRLLPRVHCFLLRLSQFPRLRRLGWLSGVAVPAGLLCMATRASRRMRSAEAYGLRT